MLNILRSARLPSTVFSYSLPNRIAACRKPTLRFASGQPDPKQDPPSNSKSSDAMSSFGEGYATRSEEEGFGGIYGGNQSACTDDDQGPNSSGTNAEFDHTQGSPVKEEEKGRHQNKIAS